MNLQTSLVLAFATTALLAGSAVGALEGEGIQGGEVVELGNFTYQVTIQINGRSICGGGIISSTHIVTAAHCVTDEKGEFTKKPMKIVAGIHDLNIWAPTWFASDVQKVYVPKTFGLTDFKNSIPGDIAVLKLFMPLNMESNENLSILKLPTEKRSYAGEKAIISGYGWNWVDLVENPETGKQEEKGGGKDGKMRFAEANILSTEECQKGYKSKITENHLCASLVQRDSDKPEGICYGDSGGPLVYNGDTLIGVVSTSPLGCRETEAAAVYTRVSSFLDFVYKAVKDVKDKSIRTTTLMIVG
ncbi:trypsin-3-like [Nasonia vitripennis]|uniref:Peptidase S1 domain-containing protein n=1 Tax=Nasonia vitripennis TaxID=7425 RepID=A0A7M7IKP5_NASVI|nr:trypsin-3-like [Nasonia vitripennis]